MSDEIRRTSRGDRMGARSNDRVSLWIVFFILAAFTFAGCASGGFVEGGDASAEGDAAPNNPNNAAEDTSSDDIDEDVIGLEGKFDLCVLSSPDQPTGGCAKETIIDFVPVEPFEEARSLLRVSNAGDADTVIENASISDTLYYLQIVEFVPDADGVLLPETRTLPFTLSPLRSIFFEVSLTAPSDMGPLPEASLDIQTDLESAPLLNIPIVAEVFGCEPGFASCDGDDSVCEASLQSSIVHCGACDSPCQLPNGIGACSEGSCGFDSCIAGFQDANDDLSDGCECAFLPGTDDPDDDFTDTNCDGVDGDVSRAVFVAADGVDTADGTKKAPLLTISAALVLALQDETKDHIYVSEGVYPGGFNLINGVSIFGGFSRDNSWRRGRTFETIIENNVAEGGFRIGVLGADITNPTTLANLTIRATSIAEAASPGISTCGLFCNNCTGLRLRSNIIEAGDAGPGLAGGPGSVPSTSSEGGGGDGGSGDADDNPPGDGGAGGVSSCNQHGGAGGRGGSEGDNNGVAGSTSANGSPGGGEGSGAGGSAGSGGDPGGSGGGGKGGAAGNSSPDATGGVSWEISPVGIWVGDVGASASGGTDGLGGGGGGGGGGQGCTFCNNGAGDGGGGGGAGGCAGGGGGGGAAGGGSFGVYLVNSTGALISTNQITTGKGGDGGAGGNGGSGSTGGAGGLGKATKTNEIGKGGNGGAGGNGGSGGHGGGGSGGVSYPVFLHTTVGIDTNGNVLNPDSPGAGGVSSGGPSSQGGAGSNGNFYP